MFKRSSSHCEFTHSNNSRIGWGDGLAALPYGEKFHKTRKLSQDLLSQNSVKLFEDVQLNQVHVLLKNLLRSPLDFSSHVKRYVGLKPNLIHALNHPRFASAIILEIAYGRKVESNDDPYLQLSERMDDIVAGLGGTGVTVIDFLPICALILWSELANKLTERRPTSTLR